MTPSRIDVLRVQVVIRTENLQQSVKRLQQTCVEAVSLRRKDYNRGKLTGVPNFATIAVGFTTPFCSNQITRARRICSDSGIPSRALIALSSRA